MIIGPEAGHLSFLLFIYLIAFLNIGIHWVSHYHMFRSIKRSNAWLVVLNFAFLLCVTLLFLPTIASIEYENVFTSRFYYIAQTTTAFLLVLMWVCALQKHRLLDTSVDPQGIRRTTARLLRNLLIFAVLGLLTFIVVSPINILAYFLYLSDRGRCRIYHTTRTGFFATAKASIGAEGGFENQQNEREKLLLPSGFICLPLEGIWKHEAKKIGQFLDHLF